MVKNRIPFSQPIAQWNSFWPIFGEHWTLLIADPVVEPAANSPLVRAWFGQLGHGVDRKGGHDVVGALEQLVRTLVTLTLLRLANQVRVSRRPSKAAYS